MTGIYCIENKISGKKYVGKAVDINKRWRHHKHLLNRNEHHNIALQRAWKKYPSESFCFYILELCDINRLTDLEIKWIEKLGTYRNGYNMTKGGEGQLGRLLTDEQKAHLSEINMGRKNPNYGLTRSEETRRKMSISMSHKRKPLSENHRKRISNACKKVDHSSQNKAVLWRERNLVFKSVSEASEQTGFSVSGISKVCLGKRNSIFKQHFIFIGGNYE
ncbi:MAG: GIY-YIG nuclease family protein [Clostridiales bacterium]|nr:GIY-YIG nuclease family protein [Clostridiales bacterium]